MTYEAVLEREQFKRTLISRAGEICRKHPIMKIPALTVLAMLFFFYEAGRHMLDMIIETRFLSKGVAVAVATVLIFLSITPNSYAETITETVEVKDGEVESEKRDEISKESDGTVFISDDIHTESGEGIYAEGSNSKVEVTDGNVTGASAGVRARDGAEVTVTGDVTATNLNNGYGVSARGEGTKVEVEGDVTGKSIGIFAYDNATVNVDGNVKAQNGDIMYVDENDNELGYSQSAQGIQTDGSADITVLGNVSGVTEGIMIEIVPDNKNQRSGTIIVDGIVSSSGENDRAIELANSRVRSNDGYISTVENMKVEEVVLPTIILYAIEGGGELTFDVSKQSSDFGVKMATLTNKLIGDINYIIRTGNGGDNFSYSGDTQMEGYRTAKEGTALTIKVTEGYEATTTGKATLTKNADGTYTLIVPRGGNVTISALKAAIKQAEEGGSDSIEVDTGSDDSGSDNGYVYIQDSSRDAYTAPVGAIEYAILPGDVAYMNVNLAALTPLQYQTAILNVINQMTEGGTLRLEVDQAAYLDTTVLNKLATRPDLDVEIIYMLGGKKYKIIIPKGYPILALIDFNGYCSFARLASILGSTEVE